MGILCVWWCLLFEVLLVFKNKNDDQFFSFIISFSFFSFLKKIVKYLWLALNVVALSLSPYTSISSWCIKNPKNPDDKKGVDRSSTVIARDGTEGRFYLEGWFTYDFFLAKTTTNNVLQLKYCYPKRENNFIIILLLFFSFWLMIIFA